MKRYTFQSRPKELQNTDVRVTTELFKENTRSLEEIISLDPDTTKPFKQIKKIVYPVCSSLPLLIYNLAEVVSVCIKNINECPHSVLQIFQALAREVRQELCPFFIQILESLVKLSEKNDLLEEIFSCISISLKYSIKNLDCKQVLKAAEPLLAHKDSGVRHLSSQSFSFLIRKDLSLLQDLSNSIGKHAWELVKFSANNFLASEVLKFSWCCFESARLAHLSLAYDKKFTNEL